MNWNGAARRLSMRLIRTDRQLRCTFCGKSQQDAKKLIASPDHLTYICDECTLEPSRLKTGSNESDRLQPGTASLSDRVVRFFQNRWDGPSSKRLRCSFCRKRASPLDSYVPSSEGGAHAQICKDCLVVCRQILTDEANENGVQHQSDLRKNA
jgi:ATP-dependent protease Clp ATPase subunit